MMRTSWKAPIWRTCAALLASVVAMPAYSQSLSGLESTGSNSITAGYNTALYDDAVGLANADGLRVVFLDSEGLRRSTGTGLAGSKLIENDSGQIVVVNGSFSDQDVVKRLLAGGNYIITVGNSEQDVAQNALDMLADMAVHGKLVAPVADYNRKHKGVRTVTTITDELTGEKLETVEESLVTVRYFSPYGSNMHHIGEMDLRLALVEAIHWTRDHKAKLLPVAKLAAVWTYITTNSGTKSCNSAINYGKVNWSLKSVKVRNDTDKLYDYWMMAADEELVPNRALDDGFSFVENGDITNHIQFNPTSHALLDYDPLNTTTGTATSTIDVSLSLSESAGVTGSYGYSYGIPDVTVNNYSDSGRNLAQWQHKIKSGSAISRTSAKFAPAVLYRAYQGQALSQHYYNAAFFANFKRLRLFRSTLSCAASIYAVSTL
jgi:hypothetical protein